MLQGTLGRLGIFSEAWNRLRGNLSPVVRFESVRSVIALAIHGNMKLHQMDVKTAFLNGELHEEVFIRQPEGFIEEGREHLVCRLKKSIYGLK